MSRVHVDENHACRKAYKAWLRHSAEQLCKWETKPTNLQAMSGNAAALAIMHAFEWVDAGGSGGSGGCYVCRHCFCATRSKRRLRELNAHHCAPMHARLYKQVLCSVNLGHEVWITYFAADESRLSPIVVCRKCGAHAGRQFRALGCVCKGGGRAINSWRRVFLHGRHPRCGSKLVAPVRLEVPTAWNHEFLCCPNAQQG